MTQNTIASIVSQIRVSLFSKDNLRALASIKLAEVFLIDGVRIIEGKNGLFISMPSRKTQNGEYKDVAYPITKEAREELQSMVLAEYRRLSSSTLVAA